MNIPKKCPKCGGKIMTSNIGSACVNPRCDVVDNLEATAKGRACPKCSSKLRRDICDDIGLDVWVCPKKGCGYYKTAW